MTVRQPAIPADFAYCALVLSLLSLVFLPAVMLTGYFGLPLIAVLCLISAAQGVYNRETCRPVVRDIAHAATCGGLLIILHGVNMNVDSPFYGASTSWEQRLEGRRLCAIGGWVAGVSALTAYLASR